MANLIGNISSSSCFVRVAIRLAIFAVLLVSIGAAVVFFGGKHLQNSAISQISEITGTSIRADSIQISMMGSVRVKGLEVRPWEDQSRPGLLKADNLHAKFRIGSLLILKPRIKEINIDGFVVTICHDIDKDIWNMPVIDLDFAGTGGWKVPDFSLRNGRIDYTLRKNGFEHVVAKSRVEAVLEKGKLIHRTHDFKILLDGDNEPGHSVIEGRLNNGLVEFTGQAKSDDLLGRRGEWKVDTVAGELTIEDGKFSFDASLKGLDLLINSADAAKYGFDPLFSGVSLFERVGTVRQFFDPTGAINVSLQVAGDLRELEKTSVTGKLIPTTLSVFPREMKYRLEDLKGEIEFTENTSRIVCLVARHGDSELELGGWTEGFGDDSLSGLEIHSDALKVDQDLRDMLPVQFRDLLTSCKVEGKADISYRYDKKSASEINYSLRATPLGMSAAYDGFPYPLQNLTGSVLVENNHITLNNIVSDIEGRSISLNGGIGVDTSKKPSYDVVVEAYGIPFDERLQKAIGGGNGEREFFIKAASAASQSGRSGITGWCRLCSGNESEPAPQFDLAIEINDLELTDELYESLPHSVKNSAGDIRLKGPVLLAAHAKGSDLSNCESFYLEIDCMGNELTSSKLPRTLNEVTGKIVISKEAVEVIDLSGTFTDALSTVEFGKLFVNGKIETGTGGPEKGNFSLRVKDLLLDDTIANALPERLADFYKDAGLSGSVDLNLAQINLDQSYNADLEGTIKLKDVSSEISGVNNLYGILTLNNNCDPNVQSMKLEADSVTIKGIPLTGLNADILFDSNSVCLTSRHFTANCSGGNVSGSLNIDTQNIQPKFTLQTAFSNINLSELPSSHNNGPQNSYDTGVASGTLCFTKDQLHGTVGRCVLYVSDMRVGETGAVSKILRALQLSRQEDHQFENLYVDGYITKNMMLLSKVDISGVNMAFNGSGTLDLTSKNIELALTARGKRHANGKPGIFGSLTEELSHGVIRVNVDGSFFEPVVSTKTLPVLSDTLGLFGTGKANN